MLIWRQYCTFNGDGDKGETLPFNSQVEVQISKSEFKRNQPQCLTHLGHALYVDKRCYAVDKEHTFTDNSQSSIMLVVQIYRKQLDLTVIESCIIFTTTSRCCGIYIDYAGTINLISSAFIKCNAGNANGGGIYFNLIAPSLLDEKIIIIGC